ncbi:unnamed protein product [Rotaria socialis]|uniref:Uncharacterized protein n=1 Tax=Rotaria socialis TaxID=392032 RepID=A0A818JTE0_9BILA|nr:unnamed protein product [Rotaria socialis]CAF3475478.1 unnamed protein product [Rotaria socialis]CAF3545219.1 unnamed protein product [Rotaria socialis]CAF4335521.1 unnamed protein product [Rotaria socialis]CAF4507159.1 unnamed protein product [Rotaria socialis]
MSYNQTSSYSSSVGIAVGVFSVIGSICCCCGIFVIIVCIIKHISRPTHVTPNYPVQYRYPPYTNTVSNNLPPPYPNAVSNNLPPLYPHAAPNKLPPLYPNDASNSLPPLYPNDASNNLPPLYTTTNPPDYFSVAQLDPEFTKTEVS